ncbi:protealysin inhibitor emfourin [Massilia sp. SYSU DXS3249]
MKIRANLTGGFAGLARQVELDTACLPGGRDLEALLHRVDFFGAAPSCAVGADLPRWEITVEDGGRCKSVVLADDGSLGATEWPALLAHLKASGSAGTG